MNIIQQEEYYMVYTQSIIARIYSKIYIYLCKHIYNNIHETIEYKKYNSLFRKKAQFDKWL